MSAPKKRKPIKPANFDPYEFAERWRMLLPEQRHAVADVLMREQKRLSTLAHRAASKRDGLSLVEHQPYRKHYSERALRHATCAGAMKIVREFLAAIGGYP